MDAKELDAVELTAKPEGTRVRIVPSSSGELYPIDTFLTMFELRDLDVITSGIKASAGFGTDWGWVGYGKGVVSLRLDQDQDAFPPDAFDRFIARLLKVSIDSAKRIGARELKESWWSRAEADAKAIIARAYPKGL